MPSYKVIYFDFAGRAEPIRMLLYYGQIPFLDQRVRPEEWPFLKPNTPFGQLPLLDIDGELVAQSNAICRYIGNLVGLAGKDAKENLAIDVVVDTFEDLYKLIVPIFTEEEDAKIVEAQIRFKERMPLYLQKLDDNARKNGGYIAINRLSFADIIFICAYEGLVNIYGGDFLCFYPNLYLVKKNVLAVKSIRHWIRKRPKGTMTVGHYDLKQEFDGF